MTKSHWYKKKSYPHFDLPLSEAEATKLASSAKKVSQHSFHPFLAFDIKFRRFRTKEREKYGTGTLETDMSKTRPIRVAAHKDGYIFAYYASMLDKLFEKKITNSQIDKSVLAYRKGKGSNIDFAKEVFDAIQKFGPCSVITMDVESFFDSIDHRQLKQRWKALLGDKNLPEDHYKVFRAITKYSWVDKDACLEKLGVASARQTPHPLCSPKDFRNIVRKEGLINPNKDAFGIPQGSQISAILSNIYMEPFDNAIVDEISKYGGIYRRYCDDIILIIPTENEDETREFVAREISNLGDHMEINNEKTIISRFGNDGKLLPDFPILQYLGFTFDGERTLIRSQTLSRFWRKATYSIRAAKNRAHRSSREGKNSTVFKRKIYRKFTHLGRRNFLSYVRLSESKMNGGHIARQMKKHWGRVQKELKKPRS